MSQVYTKEGLENIMGPTPTGTAEDVKAADVDLSGMTKLSGAQYEKIIGIMNSRIARSYQLKLRKQKNRAKNKNARKERRLTRLRSGK